ncbi:MAG: endonuclease/exonuclease/phosphatase family protein [Bacteroidota bacterium]
MKKNLKFLAIALLVIFVDESFSQGKINVMSFNIRYDNPKDGADQWQFRKKNLASMLPFYDVEICGMQEVLFNQAEDLKSLLPDYNYVGVGRTDGKKDGEFSPIFYDTKKLTLLESQTFWLSPTPEIPGKAWDAMLPRIVTWAKFKYKDSSKGKKPFYFFNTHFDHMGQEARRESAKLLLSKVKEIAGNQPAVITGDFNATPTDEPTIILNAGLIDTKKVSKNPHFGPDDSTFNGFEAKEIPGRLIDFIFLNNNKIKVIKHATLSNTWAGKFPSDHHAVMVRLDFD